MILSDDELKKFTLFLIRQKGIGIATFLALLNEYTSITKLASTYFANEIEVISDYFSLDQVLDDPIFKELDRLGVQFKCIWEDDYPKNLKNIADPPIILFYKGVWDQMTLNNSITVVGTRTSTSYGNKVIKRFVPDLVRSGFTIISGMAMGIDREAHLSALENQGKTIAVLAGSVHAPSPVYNKDVYKKILDSGGLILSEYAPDIQIVPGLFASRNRIVAGLSRGTLVVEAGIKSGALITANLAFDYDRFVFAIPSSIDSKLSEGCNYLIKIGKAKLIQKVEDILVEYSINKKSDDQSLESIQTKSLTESELAVYNSILFEPKFLEEIAFVLKKDISGVIVTCSLLELKGIIVKNGSGKYCIT